MGVASGKVAMDAGSAATVSAPAKAPSPAAPAKAPPPAAPVKAPPPAVPPSPPPAKAAPRRPGDPWVDRGAAVEEHHHHHHHHSHPTTVISSDVESVRGSRWAHYACLDHARVLPGLMFRRQCSE